MKQIPKMVDQMKKNVVNLYNERCKELTEVITSTIENRISAMERTLEQTIREKKNREREQEKRRAFLDNNRKLLAMIKGSLSEIFYDTQYREE